MIVIIIVAVNNNIIKCTHTRPLYPQQYGVYSGELDDDDDDGSQCIIK